MGTESDRLRQQVRDAYSAAAVQPGENHAFPVGRAFAESLGYPADLLESLPTVCTDAFAGVSNVSIFAEIPNEARVLDLGCGAGLDTLVSAQRTGPQGGVVGVDFSEPMLQRAHCAALQAGSRNVAFCQASAEELPLVDGSIDVALVNGIFNLNPARTAIFRELARVVAPGGVVYCAELVLTQRLTPEQQRQANWFA